ncbi:MAG: 4Fe-4S binding protein [candidate division Zixibacteria bacterium]|nr:4Fe-4S binding protein [candidate division Zixibacteria bacterium]MBU1470262.1 4Fe-4S binding protein [candidate division Zixibacteria bacterium]MBU2626420.1 4Fe-4S binding protein [candidate division Zixibacteria bacterium]
MSIRYLRYAIQIFFLGAITYVALGFGSNGFEAFCPFGGVEALYGLFTTSNFTCALAPLNLSIFLGVIGLTIITKRSFCGWVCPIGTINEWISRLGDKVWPKRPRIPASADRYLRLLRYPVLAVVLYFTYRIGDLVFRGYDPFYIIFSGLGHGTLGYVSYAVMGAFVIGAFFQPMFFCRYFCPLAAALDPFSKIGLMRVSRNKETCIDCTICNQKCHFGLEPMVANKVTHRDCVNCLECVEACPVDNCLEVKAF